MFSWMIKQNFLNLLRKTISNSSVDDERLEEGPKELTSCTGLPPGSCVDDRMEEGLEVVLNPLNITGQPPAPMLRMRGWRRGCRSF
jgi:hypothetical protein